MLFTFPCPVLSQLKTILETILGDVEGLYLRVRALEHRPAFKRRRCGLRAASRVVLARFGKEYVIGQPPK